MFVDGYWDYEPDDRGLMFAPIRIDRETVQVTQQVRRPVLLEETYWPQVAIEPRQAMAHWFTQPAYTHYYFGNYYDPGFAQRGIVPWVVQTVDMLFAGDRAEAFTRVEAEVLDQYSEQLQQYGAFTDERLALRAELGDEATAAAFFQSVLAGQRHIWPKTSYFAR